MPEWLWIIIVGVVVLGLISLVYTLISKNYDRRLNDLEKWKEKRPMSEELLTKSIHAEICDTKIDKLEKSISKQIDDIKEYFDVKIERDILVELRKLNGPR